MIVQQGLFPEVLVGSEEGFKGGPLGDVGRPQFPGDWSEFVPTGQTDLVARVQQQPRGLEAPTPQTLSGRTPLILRPGWK